MPPLTIGQVKAVRKNTIINGDMRIAQRGGSFPAAVSGTYPVDRWRYAKSGIVVHTITQDSSVPNDQFNYSLKFDCTTADAAVAAGDFAIIQQAVEGYNFRKFVGQTATLSFWAKAGKTGIMCVSFRNAEFVRSYVSEVIINAANTWEKKEVTLDFDFSGGTWNYTNGMGLRIAFSLMAGSTYQTTPDTWQTGTHFATANQTNFVDNTDATCNVWITGVQLELGSVATDFEFVDYGVALTQCQRYYYRIAPGVINRPICMCANWNSSSRFGVIEFPTTMRAAPTGSVNSGTDFDIYEAGGVWVTAAAAPTSLSVHNCEFSSTSTITTTGLAGWFRTRSANTWVAFDAEL